MAATARSSAPLVVDMHCHLLPDRLVEALRRRDTAPAIEAADGTGEAGGDARSGGDRIRIFRTAMPFDATDNDPANRLRAMNGWGVDLQVISLPGLFGIDSLPLAEAAELTRLFNDGTAEIVRTYPDRFRAVASLPLADVEAAVAEARRAAGLGHVGVILPADAFRTRADAEAWRPVLAAAAESGLFVFVHPGPLPADLVGRAVDAPAPHGDTVEHRRVTIDIQNRVTDAMVTLTLTDLLDPWPELAVQVANLGGALPFYLERMDLVDRMRNPDRPPASERLRAIHVDTASFGPRAVAATVDAFGADRVLFGTDHPVFDVGWSLDGVRGQAGHAPALLGGNAARLLKL